MSGFDNVPVVTRRGLHRRKSFSSLSVAVLILSIISLVLSCFSLLVYLGIKLQLRNVPVLTAMPGITFKPLYEGYTVQVAFSDGDSSRVTTTSNIKKDIASFTDDWIDATKKVLEEENIQSPDFIDLLAALPRR